MDEKKNTNQLSVATGMGPEECMLYEMSQAQKDTHVLTCMWKRQI